jgi:Kef-type K+ transport system membrane component KefB
MIIATLFAFIAKGMKQPLIPAYILTGIIIGPIFGLITNTDVIATISEIGIAFLLFIAGLEINVKRLKDVGLVSSIGGLIQMLSVFTAAFILAVLLGFVYREAVYLGLIIAFSSTMVVVKLLSDKREIDTLHGRIIMGILLMQDIIAILALSILTTIGDFSFSFLLLSIIKGIVVFLVAVGASRFLFPLIFEFAARSQELLFITAVAVSFAFSILFYYVGFSIAIGAFVAGVTLANLPYNVEIIGKVKSLRDFFAVIFFASLGMELLLGSFFKTLLKPFIIFIILVIFLKPLITMFLCSFFGYKKRTAFLTSISLAQVSEFSLIIVAQGMLLGHISQEILSLTVIMAVVTIVLTSYFVKYEDKIYLMLAGTLDVFDKLTGTYNNLEYVPRKKHEVILCGYNRIGYSIVNTLKRLKKKLLVIDFNPEVIRNLINERIPCIYGDIGDVEVLERLNLKEAKMVISTAPVKTDNLLLIKKTKEQNKKAIIFVTASRVEDALRLYNAGADYVILPHFLGGEHVSLLIEEIKDDINRIIPKKIAHIKELNKRKLLGHEHPRHDNHA